MVIVHRLLIGGKDIVHYLLDGGVVGNLLKPLFLDNFIYIGIARHYLLKNDLARGVRNRFGFDKLYYLTEQIGVKRCFGDILSRFVHVL